MKDLGRLRTGLQRPRLPIRAALLAFASAAPLSWMPPGNLERPLRLSFSRGLWEVHSSSVMRISSLRRENPLTGRPPWRAVAFLALAAVIVFGATWAKVSRYDARAL